MKESARRWFYRAAMAVAVAIIASALAYSLPIDFALLMAVDVAAYCEVVLAVYVISQTAPWRIAVRALWVRARLWIGRYRRGPKARARHSRPARHEGIRRAGNEDDPGFALALAA